MSRKIQEYLNEVLQAGEERKRLTSQLIQLAGEVAETIAATLPDSDTVVTVQGYAYHIQEYKSNLDKYVTIAVDNLHDDRSPGAITSKVTTAGGTFNLHRDLHAIVNVADRDEYLHFVNHLPAILEGFRANEQRAIKRLRDGFERLRLLAEEGR